MHARRIRISFSDPDATDSDSGDDASAGTPGSTTAAAVKTEIMILVGKMTLASSDSAENSAGRGSQVQAAVRSPAASGKERGDVKAAERRPAPKNRYRGVHERQPGRWAAEFRSHRLKVRHWLGTFPTEEEAKAAYDAFEAQFLSQSQSANGVLRQPESAGSDGSDIIHRSASLPPPDEKKPVVLALMSAATMKAAMEPSATAREFKGTAVPSMPCVSSLTTVSPSLASPQNAQLLGHAPASFHKFWEEESTEEDLIGLADLSHLSLPFLDGNLDNVFSMADLSLFDAGGFL